MNSPPGRIYVSSANFMGWAGLNWSDNIDELLDAVGLLERGQDRADTFSGGMKRRLNLAAGLVHKPRFLLLDEPTVGVDPQSRNHIFEEIRRLNSQGLTILYTSHYMEEVQALCARVGILDQGSLIACDSVRNLLNTTGEPNLERVFLRLTGRALRD